MTPAISHKAHLERRLGFKEAYALVVGSIIGTGVFLKTATMSQLVGGLTWVLAAWLVAGLMSFLGTLVYSELSSRFPQAGGEYVFLRETFGEKVAFLYGWTRFWIASPASIAAYAVGSATFLGELVPLDSGAAKITWAVLMIGIFTLINCTRVTYGGTVQVILTWIKMVLVIGLTSMILIKSPNWAFIDGTGQDMNLLPPTLQNFGLAVLSALWAFDGWNNMPMAAGEVRSPHKTLPAALLFGIVTCFILYAAANFAYFVALPLSEIVTANSREFSDAAPVAIKAALATLGPWSVPLLSIGFVISALGAMNGSILTGARVPYAMARDRAFFKFLSNVGSSSHVPIPALVAQGLWASTMACSQSFDQLTDYVVFSSWVFYALCGISVVRLHRQSTPTDPTIFVCPGHPLVPIAFVLCSIALLTNTVMTMPVESMVGSVLILSGLPVLSYFRRHQGPR